MKNDKFKYLVISVVSIFLIFLYIVFFCSFQKEAVVLGHEWTRFINIEQYRRTVVEDTTQYPPKGAYRISSWEDLSHYDSDGDPVYETHYRYLIDKWVVFNREQACGYSESNKAKPHWPDMKKYKGVFNLKKSYGNIRHGGGHVEYKLVLICDGKKYKYSLPMDLWEKYYAKEKIHIDLSLSGKIHNISKIKLE